MSALTPDPWTALRRLTPARIALGRAGASQPTAALLAFGLAHAQARDAVHTPLDTQALGKELAADGWPVLHVHSQAPDRAHYLRRPDLGRRLSQASAHLLEEFRHQTRPGSLVFVLADGLSATAVQRHARPLLQATREALAGSPWPLGPVVIAEQARVALGDEVGACLAAQAIVLLVGERPGLSSPDSLGVYLTWAARPGRLDSERNCISNIRPEGLSSHQAAGILARLLEGAHRLGATGVRLKDTSPLEAIAPADTGLRPSLNQADPAQ
jgi:ethanolamine ammonia-lyase small subunit